MLSGFGSWVWTRACQRGEVPKIEGFKAPPALEVGAR